MTSFAPVSTLAVSDVPPVIPIDFFAQDDLVAAVTEAAPSGMLWLNDLTDTLAITLVELVAPILAMRSSVDTLAIAQAVETFSRADVVKAGTDTIAILANQDRIEDYQRLFSPAENRGIIVRADRTPAEVRPRNKTQIVGRDRSTIIVGADDRKGEGSGQ